MFEIKYDTWEKICNSYRELSMGAKKASLQWFPFTKLTDQDWEYLKDLDFYKKYIENGSFVLFNEAMCRSENYIQKSDGSFRDASLISPLLYLVLQSIGLEISKLYNIARPEEISVFYSGKYENMDIRYKREYDLFFKEVNSYQENYMYYIKTDITNFYPNICVDKLINMLDQNCNSKNTKINQTTLQLIKELLLYVGNGRFPLVENSIMLSFLSTIVYLDEVDTRLYNYIMNKMENIRYYKMIRYVDDLYILFSPRDDEEDIRKMYTDIRNEYSSILKDYGLALNTKKCKLGFTKDINSDLKKSLYDEFYCGEKHQIEELYGGSLVDFLRKLLSEIDNEFPDVERYNTLVEQHFSHEDVEFTATEVFNYFVYECEEEASSSEVSTLMVELIKKNISVLSLDPKRLGVLVMKTHNDKAIKATLNELFTRNRKGLWNSYDTTIAIAYLVQSEFKHIDLLSVLEVYESNLYNYYHYNCKKSFIEILSTSRTNALRECIGNDWKAFYLFFMYWVENDKNNNLEAYAFFKNYFDRMTANLDYIQQKNKGNSIKRPNYRGFYKNNAFLKFYEGFDAEELLEKAHNLRNENPVSHSSACLIDNNSTSEALRTTILGLNDLLLSFIEDNDMSTKAENQRLSSIIATEQITFKELSVSDIF